MSSKRNDDRHGHLAVECISQLQRPDGDSSPLVIAHRGSSARAPENTISAFRAAVDDGADWIELDVQRTSDGAVVVIHDTSLRRTTGHQGRIPQSSYERISQLDCGSWFGAGFSGERIPLLRDVLEVLGPALCVNIEMKSGAVREDHDEFAGRVAEIVRAVGAEKRVVLSSFDHRLMRAAFLAAPEIARATIMSPLDLKPPWRRAQAIESLALVLALRQLRRRRVQDAHRYGLPVLVYTVDGPRAIERCLRAGVDGIFTNDPAATRRTLHSLHTGRPSSTPADNPSRM